LRLRLPVQPVQPADGSATYKYEYNQFNQLESIDIKADSATSFSDFTDFTYDGRGNQDTETLKNYLSVKTTVGGNSTTSDYDKTTNYGFDLSNQLTTLSISTPSADTQGVVTNLIKTTTNKYNAGGNVLRKPKAIKPRSISTVAAQYSIPPMKTITC
jgi:hypothetical protein